ncbi:MAG: class I SAM-dependent methyltransferase [Gammaproteobacteria bacterium]|nr:class I SAM-dependent methyltransferase [Gammaproteobacteria bacterium]NIR83008.1 class I SAM-dependent methyltransferase [Gammaproteobacteria bacterium]NIR90663.1 class I SAM-dependent methyltransferase [Gammaproteobacteria bacterium]NIU04165.1 class I SAM-dependent methyltransferase [Gammaproteobacteria bacterium]NIV51456.1 methyltransferase domain-containing protein [Gammaproteobacteria bacterium]
MTTFDFDEEGARRIEAVYQTPDVVATRCEILKALNLRPGERVLDIGSGPGLLAYDVAATVGPSGRVCGIDVSDSMLAMARRRCAAQGWVEFEASEATRLPYEDGAFDAAVSIQVYEYVENIPGALGELHRVLRPGGRAVIMDTDYDSLVMHTEDKARMARVLSAWDEHFVHGDLPRTLTKQLRNAGLTVRHRDVIPLFNPEYHTNTYSHGMIGVIAGFVPGRQGVTKEEAEAWATEFTALGEKGAYFFSLNRYLFVADKPAAA